MSISSYDRYPLLFGPSPVHRLERLSRHLGGAALWAKREDCNSGIAYGGNKTRKLEYLVADALAQGCDTLEVAEQERELGVWFDTVIVCSVTGSTQAGMVAGFAALAETGGRPRRVIGIDASAEPRQTREQITRIARHTAELIGVRAPVEDSAVELDERYHAGGYGVPDESTLEAMRVAARLEGMVTDPVYEGKSMAGLIDLVSRAEIGRDSTVLYAHLGGQPALNAYSALFS